MNDGKPKRWKRRLAWSAGVIALLLLFGYFTRDFWLTTLRSYFIGRSYLAAEEFGRYLPPVDEVEILAVGGKVPEGTPDAFSRDLGVAAGTVNRLTIHGREAEEIAEAWRHIDFDRRYASLCHDPYYALRFRSRGKLVLETSICWKCSTYTLPVSVFGPVPYGFDAKSEEAQTLLSKLSSYAPHPGPK